MTVIAALTTGCCALLASACSGRATSAASSRPQRGGTLTLAGLGDIDFLDPTAGYNTDTHTEERAWTRQLFSYPASTSATKVDTPVPDVASVLPTVANGGTTDGGKTYTIHLRPNVTWNTSPPRAVTAGDFSVRHRLGTLLGGAIVTENVFGLPGLGELAVNPLSKQDLPTIIGIVLLASALVVVASLIVDALYSILDPGVRLA